MNKLFILVRDQWTRKHTTFILVTLLLCSGYAKYRKEVLDALILGGGKATKFENSLGSNSQTGIPSIYAVNQGLAGLSIPSGNIMNAISITSYGAVGNAVVSGDTTTGTDASAPFNAMIAAAQYGQVCIIPPGDYSFHNKIDTLNKKRIVLWVFGRVHLNKRGFIKIYPGGGADFQHDIRIFGEIVGIEGLPGHTKVTHDNGTAPQYKTFPTGCIAFEIGNASKNNIEFNQVTGCYAAVKFRNGGGLGSQENTIAFQYMYNNAIGVLWESYDGSSFSDKTTLIGRNGGQGRINGGLATKAVDLSGNFTGAVQWPTFEKIVFERLDSIVDWQMHVVYAGFVNCSFEDGNGSQSNTTGVYGDKTTAILMKKTGSSATRVENTYLIGCKFIYADLLTNGIGINGSLTATKIWVRDLPIGNNAAELGSRAVVDGNGYINIMDAPGSLSLTNKNRAPSIFKFRQSENLLMEDTTVTSSTYSIASKDRWVIANNASFVGTLPAAATSLKRDVSIININGASASVSGLTYGSATIAANSTGNFHSNGAAWMRMDDGNTGSGGSSQWTGTNPIYFNGKVGIGITSPTAWLDLGAPTGVAGSAPIKLHEGTIPAAFEPGAIWPYGGSISYDNPSTGQREKLLTENSPVKTLYTSDGSVTSRTVTVGSNINFYGGYIQTGGTTLPTTGDVGINLLGNTVMGKLFGSGVWNNSTLKLGGALNLPAQAGTGTRMLTTDASGNVGNQAVPVGVDPWNSGTPTYTIGAAAGSGGSVGVTGDASNTNSSGRITLTTGSSVTGAGTFCKITCSGSSSAVIPTITEGNGAGNALSSVQFLTQQDASNAITISGKSALATNSIYIFFYHIEKK